MKNGDALVNFANGSFKISQSHRFVSFHPAVGQNRHRKRPHRTVHCGVQINVSPEPVVCAIEINHLRGCVSRGSYSETPEKYIVNHIHLQTIGVEHRRSFRNIIHVFSTAWRRRRVWRSSTSRTRSTSCAPGSTSRRPRRAPRGTTTRWPTTSRRRSNRCVEPWCGTRRLAEVVVDGDVEPLLYYDGGAESRCGDWTVGAWAGPRAARSSRAARPGATRR